MMESGRCGRRKQRNPKRKNVDHDLDADTEEQTALDDNSNEITIATQSPSRSSSASNHSDWEDIEDATSSNHGNINGNHGDIREQVAPNFIAKLDGTEESSDWSPVSTLDDDKASQTDTISAAPDSTSTEEKKVDESHTAIEARPRMETEAEKIAKYLSRRDTAVIYAEPVGDADESQNDEGNCSEEEIILKCMHCPQTFLRAIILRDHMREMHADKPLKFMCPKCDETFHQKSQLDKHLTLHSPTSQVCPICNKTFANVYRLQRHMISHDESNDLRKFKCMECGKAFKFKHHLKEHVRIHSGEKPFECPNCRKRFSHSGSYSSHMTSKKCWVVSAHKNRLTGDGSQTQAGQTVAQLSQNTASQSFGSQSTAPAFGMFNQKLPVSFADNKMTFSRPPLPAIASSLAPPLQQTFIPTSYAPQKAIPGFYPPHMFRTPDGMFPYPVFSVPQGIPGHFPPGLRLPTIPGRPFDQSSDAPVTTTSIPGCLPVSTVPSVESASHTKTPPSTSVPITSSQPIQTSPSQSQSIATSSSPNGQSATSVSSPSQPEHSSTPVSQSASSTTSHSEDISPDINPNAKLLQESAKEQMVTSSDMEDELKSKTNTDAEPKSNEAENSLDMSIKMAESAEKNGSDEVDGKDNVRDDKVESKSEERKEKIACQFCGEVFNSPITHHQHERYMCKQNKEIVQHMAQVDSRQSPHSTVSDTSLIDSTATGSAETETDDDDIEEMYRDLDTLSDDKNSKMRIRTLFTDEQLNVLKAQYLLNPRPRKFELIRIGNKIGFPKRVVQVWFQNMRARDRKQGKDFVYSLEAIKSEMTIDRELSKSPTYIPNVPQPYPHKLNGHHEQSPAHVQPPSKLPGESPLDLSLSRTPPLAHGGISRLSTPDRSTDNQVLNLSVRRGQSEPKDMRGQSEPRDFTSYQPAEIMTGTSTQQQMQNMASFRDSAIFKYMQQEGMILNKRFPMPPMSLSPSLQQILHNQILSQSMAASVVNALHFPPISSHLDIPKLNTTSSLLFDSKRTDRQDSDTTGRLVIDEHMKDGNPKSRELPPLYRGDAPQFSDLPEDTRNLATLAEAAQHAANILSGKPKRLRKKTWRQMESEEVQLDFEDSSMSADDDEPSKKKRKSWKNHRVDREEGMYACDQCNKMFSKQSSLARHKYEHSGARPFLCDLCPKSFKHKHHLTEHKRLHSGEKPFQCKKCGKRFSHSGSFSQHMNHRYNYCSPHKPGDAEEEMSM